MGEGRGKTLPSHPFQTYVPFRNAVRNDLQPTFFRANKSFGGSSVSSLLRKCNLQSRTGHQRTRPSLGPPTAEIDTRTPRAEHILYNAAGRRSVSPSRSLFDSVAKRFVIKPDARANASPHRIRLGSARNSIAGKHEKKKKNHRNKNRRKTAKKKIKRWKKSILPHHARRSR